SYLNVRGIEALLEAIRMCRESARTRRVHEYRVIRGGPTQEGIGVLVQRMVAADAAGVAFTADPVTGAREQVRLVGARGLGERVVGGEASGDEWVVAEGGAKRRRSTEMAINAGQAAAVAALARRVEAHFGPPQDIEWAIAGRELYLLQARPMTALPEP